MISIQCQEIRLWELIKWSPKRKCLDLLLNSLNSFLKEMYGDQFGEFVCGYWDLKGQREIVWHFIGVFIVPNVHNCRLEIQNFNTRREISYLHTVKASIYISQKNAFLSLTVEAILSCLLYCFYPGIVQVIRVRQLRTDQGVQRPNWCLCDWWYYSRYLTYVSHILAKIWTF